MFKKSKRLIGLCLGVILSLGVGVGLETTHGEAVGVEAADTATVTLTAVKTGQTTGDGTDITSSTEVSSVFTESSYISSLTSFEKAYYNGCKGLKLGTSSRSGYLEFSLKNPLTSATKVVVNAKLYSDSKAATLKIDQCSDSEKSLTSSFADYTFTFSNKNVSSLKITGSKYCWISSITLYEEAKTPTVTSVSISPSETTMLVVGKTMEYTVKIEGNNLTEEETVTAYYEEYELDEPGVEIDKTTGIKSGNIITAKALTAGANGLLEVKYDDTIYASVEISTEAAKTPVSLSYEGTLTTTDYIEGQALDPTGLTFKAFYEGDTTGSEIDVSHITFSPETLSLGTTKVTASYTENEVKVSCDIEGINVEADYIGNVKFDFTNAKTSYDIGSTLDASSTGVTATGIYKVNNEKTISIDASDLSYSGFDSSKGGTQTITVSYTNVKSETFSDTYTITIISETLEKKGSWSLVKDASTLKVGDKLVIASNSNNVTASSTITTDNYMKEVASTFSNDKSTITSLGNGSIELTLGGKSGAWTLSNGKSLLGATDVKKVAWGSGTTTWTISINSSNAVTIQNTNSIYGRILYNVNSDRFTTYTSSTNTSMLLPQLYRLSYETHDASLALVNTVKTIYNDGYLSCDTNGANSTIQWTEIANLFDTNVTDADELEFLKGALSDETAVNGTIKKFLADYDYILSKYNSAPYSKGYVDFLERNPTSSASSIRRISYANDNNTAILIVVLVSFASLTAIGGYFFIRKKRYN